MLNAHHFDEVVLATTVCSTRLQQPRRTCPIWLANALADTPFLNSDSIPVAREPRVGYRLTTQQGLDLLHNL